MRILFLCTGNSARSQMAEALLRRMDPELDVHSAGTRPAGQVHWGAVRALAECEIEWKSARPKSVDVYRGQVFDYVITLCGNADQACGVFPGKAARLHIPFDDPAAATGTDAEILNEFRRVRDEIEARLRSFYVSTVPLHPASPSDYSRVAALLAGAGLPEDGLAEHFGAGYVIAGSAAGCAGVERCGDYGLLRSVAVAPQFRRMGLGARLVADRIAWARHEDMRALYLLTTTAASYFPKAGFQVVARDRVPPEVRQSREFADACPASATVMMLPL